MTRGTFANIRIRNLLAPGTEGGVTRYLGNNVVMPIYDAAMKYKEPARRWSYLRGEEYGTGSARATGPPRGRCSSASKPSSPAASNGSTAAISSAWASCRWFANKPGKAGPHRRRNHSTSRSPRSIEPRSTIRITATKPDGTTVLFDAKVRIDTPVEMDYYRNGGILQTVLRKLLKKLSLNFFWSYPSRSWLRCNRLPAIMMGCECVQGMGSVSMRRYAIVGFAILGLSLVRPAGVRAEEFFIAHWNVENLFDTVDDPNVSGDEEFTPDSPKHWDDKRLETKVDNLSKIICKMNDGHGPDVLGLCEVENRKVVEMLVAKLGTLGRDYQIVHKDSPSERGIDCALVYDAKVFKLADSKFHHVDAGNTVHRRSQAGERRGAALCVCRPSAGPDARRGPAQCRRGRAAPRRNPGRRPERLTRLRSAGDFNEDPDSVALKDHLHAVDSSDQMPAGAVFDTSSLVHAAGKGTFVWDDKWQMLDHIILMPGMLDEAGYHWKADSSQPVEFPEQLFHSKREGAIDSPSKSYSKNNFHTDGYSDHLPVSCTIVK